MLTNTIDLDGLVKRFELRNFAIPMQIHLDAFDLMSARPFRRHGPRVLPPGRHSTVKWTITADVLFTVPDRDTGQVRSLRFVDDGIPVERFDGDAEAFRTLRGLVKYILLHEMDEAIHVDGRRVFDPHVYQHDPMPEYHRPPSVMNTEDLDAGDVARLLGVTAERGDFNTWLLGTIEQREREDARATNALLRQAELEAAFARMQRETRQPQTATEASILAAATERRLATYHGVPIEIEPMEPPRPRLHGIVKMGAR